MGEAGASSVLRLLSLTIILCRAGLGSDLVALRRLASLVGRLSSLPCCAEALVIAGLSTVLLDFPLSWAVMLGFIVAAVSPAVVVPSLLALQERGYGVGAGIPTMVVAAAALDDVFSIAGFGICLGFAIPSGGAPLWFDILRAPVELIVGFLGGLLGAALLLILLPSGVTTSSSGDEVSSPTASVHESQRESLKKSGGLTLLAVTGAFGLKKAGLSGASALAVLVLSGVAAQGWASAAKPVAVVFDLAWSTLAQPCLFGLVGAAIDVRALDLTVLAYGVGMLACSLVVRCCVTYFAVLGGGLSRQERLFTALAWLPKATVQAALGAIPLDEARDDRERQLGRDVLAIAMLAVVCTAPIGASLIFFTGPKLLSMEGLGTLGTSQPEEDHGTEVRSMGGSSEAVSQSMHSSTHSLSIRTCTAESLTCIEVPGTVATELS